MPNHCCNVLEITGSDSDISSFLENCKTSSKEFSFEALLPIPGRLKESVSGSDSMGYEAKYTDGWKDIAKYPWVRPHLSEESQAAVVAFLEQARPQVMELADFYKGNIERYGCLSWYEWCLANWGTKWDAYEVEVNRDVGLVRLEFLTAWSPPIAWVEFASDKYVDLTFEDRWIEEGGMRGHFRCENGELVSEVTE